MANGIRIYVASLSDYNAGILHGEWIEVSDVETMQGEINKMLAGSPTAKQEGQPAEEWAIHDYEGFGDIRLSEYEDLEGLAQLAEGIEEHGDAFLAWVAHSPKDNRDPSNFEDAFLGEWGSMGEYAEDYWEQSGDKPQAPQENWWHPANYIAWEDMGKDLELNGDVWTAPAPRGVWVFSNS